MPVTFHFLVITYFSTGIDPRWIGLSVTLAVLPSHESGGVVAADSKSTKTCAIADE
jgi:hypothetical protein